MEILSFSLVASETGGCNSPGVTARCPGAELSPPMALTAVGSRFPRLWSWRERKAQVTSYGRVSPGDDGTRNPEAGFLPYSRVKSC